jgi:HD superfamily phosphohydrolase
MGKGYFQNKKKIINDPVYGFIGIPDELIFDLVEHPYFQRLRAIKQLGLTHFVYPAAMHTRFQHALGCVHLMSSALEVIQRKGHQIDDSDCQSAMAAILLHDIGHGPFSHALENVFVDKISHEAISLMFMEELNGQFNGCLNNAISIFTGRHSKSYLHQLVSSQLDMDRLDYLRRDSFFTGVSEGVVGSDRIIKMLRVEDNQLVVDIKGIYSVEKFLIARRLMYWQVYLHKTVTVAEQMLIKTLERARELSLQGSNLNVSNALQYFLSSEDQSHVAMRSPSDFLHNFARLDDSDVFSALKSWADSNDKVLARLSSGILYRKLLGIRIQDDPFDPDMIDRLQKTVMRKEGISHFESSYLVFSDQLSNSAYDDVSDEVMLWEYPGKFIELSKASDIINYTMISKVKNKYFLCYPKWAVDELEQ